MYFMYVLHIIRIYIYMKWFSIAGLVLAASVPHRFYKLFLFSEWKRVEDFSCRVGRDPNRLFIYFFPLHLSGDRCTV